MCVCVCTKEWDLALFDFPGQTAEDLSFHKGALIQVTEHIDAEWKRGRLEGREGLYPVAFTQPHKGTTHILYCIDCVCVCVSVLVSNKLVLIESLCEWVWFF